MGKLAFLLGCLVLAAPAQERTDASTAPPTYALVHGQWFDGRKFVTDTLYSVHGTFASRRPAHIDSVIDLRGKFVVPPYGEAHNHNIDGFKNVADRIKRYLADGIFYVKNPNSIPRHTATLAGTINIPSSVDVAFSNGGLTASGGHPLELVRRNMSLGIFTVNDAEGGMYYVIDNPADLESKWTVIENDKPDFIKTYLLYSEEFSKREVDSAYFGWRGLDPTLLPTIVERAHRDHLRVSTHVETAADFHNALAAGVDEINHLPGFRADSLVDFTRYEITEEDARAAAARGVVVVTTLEGSSGSGSAAYQERLRHLHVRNLTLLKKFGVPLAIGSDNYRQTSVPEAFYLNQLRLFDNGELLRIWCESTPATIFPQRKIGRLLDGYEASFLLLDGSPLEDFAFTQKILLRFKQGRTLSVDR